MCWGYEWLSEIKIFGVQQVEWQQMSQILSPKRKHLLKIVKPFVPELNDATGLLRIITWNVNNADDCVLVGQPLFDITIWQDDEEYGAMIMEEKVVFTNQCGFIYPTEDCFEQLLENCNWFRHLRQFSTTSKRHGDWWIRKTKQQDHENLICMTQDHESTSHDCYSYCEFQRNLYSILAVD